MDKFILNLLYITTGFYTNGPNSSRCSEQALPTIITNDADSSAGIYTESNYSHFYSSLTILPYDDRVLIVCDTSSRSYATIQSSISQVTRYSSRPVGIHNLR